MRPQPRGPSEVRFRVHDRRVSGGEIRGPKQGAVGPSRSHLEGIGGGVVSSKPVVDRDRGKSSRGEVRGERDVFGRGLVPDEETATVDRNEYRFASLVTADRLVEVQRQVDRVHSLVDCTDSVHHVCRDMHAVHWAIADRTTRQEGRGKQKTRREDGRPSRSGCVHGARSVAGARERSQTAGCIMIKRAVGTLVGFDGRRARCGTLL